MILAHIGRILNTSVGLSLLGAYVKLRDMTHELKTRVDDDLSEQVQQLADNADASLAEIQRRALREYVDNHYDDEPITEQPEEEQPETLETVLEVKLSDAPHDISIERDPDVDWTDKDVVSRTYQQRLLVLNAWLNNEQENNRVDVETVNEMITDDTHGFGMSGPTLYADRDRLEEHGIAYPSPVIDTDWDTDELLRRVIDLKKRETTRMYDGKKPESLDAVLSHNVSDDTSGENPVWPFEEEFFTNEALYQSQLRGFCNRTRTLMEKIDVDSPTHKVYHLVLEDYLDYLDSKDLVPDRVETTRAWLDKHMEEGVKSSASEKLDQLTETEAGN
jgi:hypothetical protein